MHHRERVFNTDQLTGINHIFPYNTGKRGLQAGIIQSFTGGSQLGLEPADPGFRTFDKSSGVVINLTGGQTTLE
jgi:hypothetical protein